MSHWNPFVRMTARRSAVAFATTPATAERLTQLGCGHVLFASQAALTEDDFDRLSRIPARAAGPFRVLSIGRLLQWKGFEYGMKAFAQFHRQHPTSEYWMVGDGPEKDRWKRLASALGLRDSVHFWNSLSRESVLEKIADCDVLLHPSFHDSSGWVTVEAMAAGRPVICLDLGGPGLQVTDTTGIKVRPDSPAQVISELAAAMNDLARDEAHRIQLGRAAREWAQREFNWTRKGDEIKDLYAELVRTSEGSEWMMRSASAVLGNACREHQ